MIPQREAFFIEAGTGKRFCLVTRPARPPLGALLYIPPFAEEQNKSRRTAALAAQAFAKQGWLILQLDLFGCGDSSGDFADANWSDWLEDLSLGWQWLQTYSQGPCALWSLRAGSLLAADWLAGQTITPPWLMWQPVTNGRQHLAQFLRLKTANAMLAETGVQNAAQSLRDTIQAGHPIEVAGYTVTPDLFNGLEAATLRLPAAYPAPVIVLEVSPPERQNLSPALGTQLKKWQDDQITTLAEVVSGPSFWQTVEIEEAPELVKRSASLLGNFVHV